MWMRRKYSSIALDVGRASVTACQVVRDRVGLTLHKWVAVEDPLRERPGTDALGAAPVERTARLVRQSGFRGREVILALKPPEVSFLTVKAPEALLRSSREQLLSGLKFEAARELQCDPKTLVVDGWRLPEGSRSGDNYMIAAIAESTVHDWSRFADSTGLLVRRIEVLPSALLRAAPRGDAGDDKSLWGVLDLGYGSCVLALAMDVRCVFVRQLSVDGDSLTLAIRDALGVDYGTAEILKRAYRPPVNADAGRRHDDFVDSGDMPQAVHALMKSHIKALAGELERAFGYVMEGYPELVPTVLHVSGGGAKLSGLCDALHEQLGIDVRPLDPCQGLKTGRNGSPVDTASRAQLAASVGMAIGDVQ